MTRKKKKITDPYCKGVHAGPWLFEKTNAGTKRTCTTCGWCVTEVGRNDIIVTPIKNMSTIKKRQYKEKKEKKRNVIA